MCSCVGVGKELRIIRDQTSTPTVCGDRICSDETGENCDTCATDCCPFSLPAGATAGIVLFCVLIVVVIIVIAAVVSPHACASGHQSCLIYISMSARASCLCSMSIQVFCFS